MSCMSNTRHCRRYCGACLANLLGHRDFRSLPRHDGPEPLVFVKINPVQDLRARVKRSRHWLLEAETVRLASLSLSDVSTFLPLPHLLKSSINASTHGMTALLAAALSRLSTGVGSLRSTNALFRPSQRSQMWDTRLSITYCSPSRCFLTLMKDSMTGFNSRRMAQSVAENRAAILSSCSYSLIAAYRRRKRKTMAKEDRHLVSTPWFTLRS